MSVSQSKNEKPEGGSGGITLVWALLMGFSLLNYFLAEGWLDGKQLIVVVLGASLIKLVLVAGSFMELWSRGRPYFYMAGGLFALTLGLIVGAW
jgi:hypothetical protein